MSVSAAGPGPGGAPWTVTALRELQRAAARLRCRVAADEPLARHTSMGVGGPCPLMLWPADANTVRELAAEIGRRGLRWRVLGGGTNLLISDEGVGEPVLCSGALERGLEIRDDRAHVPAGTPTSRALRKSVEAGYDGLVWAAGLPGTLGGAAAGNAGCWGGEMAQCVRYLDIVDSSGQARRLDAAELRWAYRDLRLPDDVGADFFITGVGVELHPGDPVALRERYLELQERKRVQQPTGARNSGCIFRNPDAGPAAGQLLEAAGCKGMRVGAAEISSVHANFVVNRGSATADDVCALVDAVVARVQAHAGIALRPEIQRW